MIFLKEDYENLKTDIINYFESKNRDIKEFYNSSMNSGNTETRIIWDIFWLSKWNNKNRNHKYLDRHISSALRKIVKELKAENT